MRDIRYIVVHCTATDQTAKVDAIKRYWKDILKWSRPGYHYIINANGIVEQLQNEDLPSNGVSGFNSMSVNISYIGGIDRDGKLVDNRTEQQKRSLLSILKVLKAKYPKAEIRGHRDFPNVAKACPCFDAKKEYRDI